jgi:hypothetical protein
MFKLGWLALCAATLGVTNVGGAVKSPAWLSIESPVNPYDQTTRGDVLLVHAMLHNGDAKVADLTGRAEGLVNGARRSVMLRFDPTSQPNVFGLTRQWPSEGTWIIRISLRETTAIVTFDRTGAVASALVPTTRSSGIPLPRAVPESEIDSTLTAAARR